MKDCMLPQGFPILRGIFLAWELAFHVLCSVRNVKETRVFRFFSLLSVQCIIQDRLNLIFEGK